MIYKYVPNDPSRYATNLRRDNDGGTLTWDNARNQDVLIVQTPFGQSAVARMGEICRVLSDITLPQNQYTEVLTGVWVRFVSAVDKARYNGCPINGKASTYTVFSCYTEDGVCYICEPQDQAMISPYCDIPMELHVDIARCTRVEGFIRHREVETGFFRISFPDGFGNGYVDGDMRYQVGDMEIPVTREMLEQGTVYVRTEIKPVLISTNKGLLMV